MDDWQPINTAPRDGRTILAYLPAHAGLPTRQDVVAVFWDAACGWATAYSGACLDAEPTYWMRLPDPPAAVERHYSDGHHDHPDASTGPIH
jgi:hypothetical protein